MTWMLRLRRHWQLPAASGATALLLGPGVCALPRIAGVTWATIGTVIARMGYGRLAVLTAVWAAGLVADGAPGP